MLPAVSLTIIGLVQGAGISRTVPNSDGTFGDPSRDFAGQGVANPTAVMLAGAMMLDHLGEAAAARRIEDAVVRVLRSRRLPNLGMDSGFGTDQVGDLVLAELERGPAR